MSSEDVTKIVICGDSCTEPQKVAAALEHAAKVALHDGDHATGAAPHGLRLDVWTSPPSTLVTNVDVVVLCVSLTHPLSLLHMVDRWAPLFAHLPYVRVVVAATRFELTVSPSVAASLQSCGVLPVERGDLVGAVHDIAAQFNDATVTYCAVTLNVPIADWIGQRERSSDVQPLSTMVSTSVKDLLHACVEDDAFFDEDRAAEQWRRTAEDVERDMDERCVMSEWMQVSYGYFVGQQYAAAEVTPVFVSRSTHAVNQQMPSELVRKKLIEDQADYEQRYKTLLENTPETYLLRKAAADADRRRAIDRSTRRSVVLDPVLQMHERQGVLRKEVALLENLRDKLLAAKRDNADKRQWQRDVQEQLRSSQAIIDAEPSEVEVHQRNIAACNASILLCVEEEASIRRMEKDIADKVQQREIDATLEAYQLQWNENKSRRVYRDETDKRSAEIASQSRALHEELRGLSQEADMLMERMDAHLTRMNAAQDALLLLDAQLSHCAGDDRATSARNCPSNDSGDTLGMLYLYHNPELFTAVTTVGATRGVLHRSVVAPLVALCDLEVGPMELQTLRSAVTLEKSQRAQVQYLTDVILLERIVRLSHRLTEVHQRMTLTIAFTSQCGDMASTAVRQLAMKLLPSTFPTHTRE